MVDPVTISSVFALGKSVIERIFPDPTKRAEEMRKLEEMRQRGELAELEAHVQLMLAQIDLNKAEAQSGSWFNAGWRPAVGWVGAASLALMYIPKAVVMTALWTYQNYLLFSGFDPSLGAEFPQMLPFPDLGVTDLIGLLMSMLGVAAMRSYDKSKGTQTNRIE